MSFIDKVKSFLTTAPTFEKWGGSYFYPMLGNAGANESNIDAFVNRGYVKNALVNQIVNRIAKTTAGVPFSCNSAELSNLLEKPNNSDFQEDFIEKAVINLLTTGNAFFYFGDGYTIGMPEEIKVLRTQDVSPVFTNEGELAFIEYNRGDGFGDIKILPNEFMHVKMPNTVDSGENAFFGISPLRAVVDVYEASNDVFEAQQSMMKNKGAVGLIVSEDSNMPMTPAQRKEVDSLFKDKIGGANNYGTIKTIGAKARYIDIGKTPKDLELNDTNKFLLRTLCSTFGVDSALFNDPDNKTYNNRKEATIDYYNDVVFTIWKKIFRAFEWQFSTQFEILKEEISIFKVDENEKGI